MIFRYHVNFIAVTQYFKEGYHSGMDLGWSSNYFGENQEIYAVGDGEVVEVRKDYNQTDTTGSSYGNYVKIKHNETFTTLYAHLKYGSVTVNVGDKIKQGDVIGQMGNTGYSKGTHLHYELFMNKVKINPINYTYVFNGQIVANDEIYKQGLLYYNQNEEEIESLKQTITELETRNELLSNEINYLTEKLKEETTYQFTYTVNKTSNYQIKLYEGEKLYIKN